MNLRIIKERPILAEPSDKFSRLTEPDDERLSAILSVQTVIPVTGGGKTPYIATIGFLLEFILLHRCRCEVKFPREMNEATNTN